MINNSKWGTSCLLTLKKKGEKKVIKIPNGNDIGICSSLPLLHATITVFGTLMSLLSHV